MLLFCEVSDEYVFFEKVWRLLADDIQYNFREMIGMTDIELRDHLLDDISTLFIKSGSNIRDFNLPQKSGSSNHSYGNRLIEEEMHYDVDDLFNESETSVSKLNDEQLYAFNCIVNDVLSNSHAFFFISGYGGTGKTFLWNTIVAHLRAQKKIILTVASSGVASLLLPGGRTTHSRFKIPCDLDDGAICDIKRGSMLSELIESISLVIWDEALMTHRIALEALDRTFRDLLCVHSPNASNLPFGGKIVVLGGDLRQILPVIEGGSRSQIVNATIINSPLWSHVTILHLTKNMRLLSPTLTPQAQNELAQFSKWILDIGEGNIEATTKEGESEATWIKIPHDLLLTTTDDKVSCIVNAVYPDLHQRYTDIEYLKDRAILTPTNDVADTINAHIVSFLLENEKQYLSCDKIVKAPNTHESYDLLYPVEFLNSLNGNNFPQHELTLKKGVPVMLLQNLNQSEGLCNGIRLIITALEDMVIEAQIMT